MHKTDSAKQKPLISVVMATYNGERFISEAIDSILNQSFTNYEFIIVNDGSTDTTEKIIQLYKDSRIVYINKDTNTGIADSLNIGIAAATGTYIARMDDDDVSMPQRFEKQLEVFNKNIDLIFCASAVSNKDGKCLSTPEKHEDILLKLIFSNPIFHPTVLIKRKYLLEELYNLKAVPSEDYDLWSRLIFKGQFYQIQEPLLYCRIHQTSVTARRRKEQLLKSIPITNRIYSILGLVDNPQTDQCLRAFTCHDYSISAKSLRNLIRWFDKLKLKNQELKLFEQTEFNHEADQYLKRFVVSYFINNSLYRKLQAFALIDVKHKKLITKYYIFKYFKFNSK